MIRGSCLHTYITYHHMIYWSALLYMCDNLIASESCIVILEAKMHEKVLKNALHCYHCQIFKPVSTVNSNRKQKKAGLWNLCFQTITVACMSVWPLVELICEVFRCKLWIYLLFRWAASSVRTYGKTRLKLYIYYWQDLNVLCTYILLMLILFLYIQM